MKVALDAGHGASRGHPFTGAHANGLIEDYLALDFVDRIGHHLRLRELETLLTRQDKDLIPLGNRGKLATAARCDMFLSIHCNAGPSSANGVEAFVVEGDERSREIARRFNKLVEEHGMHDRGVKWDSQSQYSRLRVLRDTYRHMPAILLEMGFLTSKHDAGLLADRYFRENIAQIVAEGITEVLNKR